jgi:PleD family two-component response regulator
MGESGVSDFLIAALHENGIRCRVERNGSRARLFVLPEDEAKAGEIVQEVVEGKPPE